MAWAGRGGGGGWGSSLWPGSPPPLPPTPKPGNEDFPLPPTPLRPPSARPSSWGRPPSGSGSRGSRIPDCSVRGPGSGPAAGRGHVVGGRSAGLAQTRWSSRLPRAVASGLGLGPPPQMRPLGGNGEDREPAPLHPSPRPQPLQPARPSCPLSPGQPMPLHLPPGKTLARLTRLMVQGAHTVDGCVKPNPERRQPRRQHNVAIFTLLINN